MPRSRSPKMLTSAKNHIVSTEYGSGPTTSFPILLKKRDLIQEQPLLHQIFKEPPIISYKKGKSSKDMFVGAKI